MHTVNIPDLMRELSEKCGDLNPVCVGVSDKPRNLEGSYMPCFLAGVSAASAISAVNALPLYRFSHQCGHIMAAIYSSSAPVLSCERFAAFHLSGGTSEFVSVTPDKYDFKTELLGGTKDLNAGQVIDRVGVYMDLPFPAGPYIEALALENTKKIPKKRLSAEGFSFNLSGLENMAKALYDETADKSLTAAFVLDYISRSIASVCEEYEKKNGKTSFVFAGGVMCNSIIKSQLSGRFTAYFAEPSMSADNAVGIACLARRRYKLEKS
jgi:N6-L-threonylcarbamoyladenine synthase